MPSVGKLGKAFGEYRAAVVRTQLHSESIAALKGAAVEQHIITQMFEQMMAVQVPTTTCARLFAATVVRERDSSFSPSRPLQHSQDICTALVL